MISFKNLNVIFDILIARIKYPIKYQKNTISQQFYLFIRLSLDSINLGIFTFSFEKPDITRDSFKLIDISTFINHSNLNFEIKLTTLK